MIRAKRLWPLLGISFGSERAAEAAAFFARPASRSVTRTPVSSCGLAFADAGVVGSNVIRLKMTDADAEKLAMKQAQSEERHHQRSVEHPDEEFATASDQIPSLAALPLVPLAGEDDLTSIDVPDHAAASALAVYDERKELQYVGASRNLKQSLRALLDGRPEKTSYVKIYHIEKKGRTFLDLVVEWWLAEAAAEAGIPPGNDGGDEQERWQSYIHQQ